MAAAELKINEFDESVKVSCCKPMPPDAQSSDSEVS